MTALATVWPATKFRFEASGRVPQGNTVTYPPPVVGFSPSVTVTFSDTAPMTGPPDAWPAIAPCTVSRASSTKPGAGSPAYPTTDTSRPEPVPEALPTFDAPRVLIRRAGVNGTNE